MGYRTVLTLSGSTKLADLPNYAYQPDRVVDTIGDLNPAQFDGLADPRQLPVSSLHQLRTAVPSHLG